MMDEIYETLPMESARAFLEYIRKSNPKWLAGESSPSRFIFRGQSNSDHKLIPTAWREDQHSIKLFENLRKEIDDNLSREFSKAKSLDDRITELGTEINSSFVDRINQYAWKIICELRLADEFINRSNNVGLKIDKVNPFGIINTPIRLSFLISQILKSKRIISSLLNGTEEQKTIELNSYHNDNFSTFALAQHHGIPTRLLDWTKNPLKAAYFAIDKIDDSDNQISVIALDTFLLSSYGIDVIDQFPHADFHFLHVQEGVFTYMRYANSWYIRNGNWPAIEDLLSNQGYVGMKSMFGQEIQINHPRPTKITLDIKHTEELKHLLEVEGVTRESLMPTYNHVAESIKDRLK